jgi:serine/threonine-protein kinase
MEPQRWKEIDGIFAAAFERDAAERPAFLAEACGGDEQLRAEVESLLAHLVPESLVEGQAPEEATLLLGKEQLRGLVGASIGPYEIVKLLGAGGMGRVYLAHDKRLNRQVAVKLLSDSGPAEEERIRRFRQEAFAASALNHPNILTIHEIGDFEGQNFIATEFIDGVTLRVHLEGRELPLTKAVGIAIQVASALSAAHEAGIVHRDIKPENVMTRADGLVKVLDFGIAKYSQADSVEDQDLVVTKPGSVIGTAPYMSPEQASGLPVDVRTDIWSLGVMLYEMVTGRLPFAGKTPSETISLILQKEPAPLARYAHDVPAELERIIRKALTKDREERYQTAKDMLIDLRNLKRKREVDAEIERAVAPEVQPLESTSSSESAPATVSGAVAATTPSNPAPSTFSAEYVISGITQHKLAAVIGLFVLVVVAVGFGLYLHARNTGVAIDSIAVLPFQNKSTETDADYLSDGLAESLVYRLSQLPNLKVSPTSSVFRYKGKEIDPVKVGQELGVNAVLSGRIVQRGDNLTISAELVDVRYNKLLWGEQYDRKMSDLLATQREIAREIVEKLKLKVSGEAKAIATHYTESNQAYQLYLKGRFYWNKRTPEALHKSIDYLQQAIEQDPGFALAYSGLADTYSLLGGPEAGGDMPPIEVLPKAKAAALKAMAIDATLAEPHVSLAHAKYFYDRDWPGAEREFKRAIELNPNYPVAHHWYAIYLTVVGRQPEALTEIRRAQELDPLSLSINTWLGRILALAGQPDQAIEQLRRTLEMDPNFFLAHYRLGCVYEEEGKYEEAISEFMQVLKLPGGKALGMTALAHTYAVVGKRAEAQKNLDQLLQLSRQQYVAPGLIAIIYVGLGDKDKAFAWLDEADKARDLNVVRLNIEPRFASLRSDPRFASLVRRVGLPP